jgi:hypothetical protein
MNKSNLRRICCTKGYALFFLFGLIIFCAGIVAQSLTSGPSVSEQYLKTAADRERAASGLPPLRFDAALSSAARRHAELMVEHNSISHQYSGEPDLARRAAAVGAHFSLVTENVAQAPSVSLIHRAWMNSEGHRHNLLDPNVDAVGIGVVSRNGQMFAVEDFARSVVDLPIRQQEATVARSVGDFGVDLNATTDDAREVCAGQPSERMARPPEFVMRYTTDNLDQLPKELSSRLQSGRYGRAMIAACATEGKSEFTMYRMAVLLYRKSGPRD